MSATRLLWTTAVEEDILDRLGFYRPDIDGLRALAILVVVAFHAGVPGFAGGFAGVDVFFVISGYLITGLLIREQRERGRIDIAAFYARRVRRLLPALSVVLIATLTLAPFILLPIGEQQSLARSVLSVCAFVSNIWFTKEIADYFGPDAGSLPLLHTWTLSVEEQFYVVWPLAVVALGAAARRWRLQPHDLMVIALAAGSLASLLAGLFVAVRWPQWTYLMTPFRVWELGAGALLALVPTSGRTVPRIGVALSLVGLAAIAASTWIGDRRVFPSAMAVVPVLGAALVILGGALAPAAWPRRLLGSRPLVAIGRLSYSWYLWHWPLLALWSASRLGARSLPASLMLSVLALGLAWLTWRYVEQPIRDRRPGPFATTGGALTAGGVMLATCAALAGGLWVWAEFGAHPSPRVAAAGQVRDEAPRLLPGCEDSVHFGGLAPAARCRRGAPNPSTTVLLWGDSHGRHLTPLLAGAATAGGYAVLPRIRSGCRPMVGSMPGGGNPRAVRASDCVAFNRAVLAGLDQGRRDGVSGALLAARWNGPPKYWKEGLRQIVLQLHARDMRVLLIADVPRYPFDVPGCVARRGWEGCSVARARIDAGRGASLEALRAIAAEIPGVAVWDPIDAMCTPTACSPVRGHTILYVDSNHLSRSGALSLEPVMTPALDWVRGATDVAPDSGR